MDVTTDWMPVVCCLLVQFRAAVTQRRCDDHVLFLNPGFASVAPKCGVFCLDGKPSFLRTGSGPDGSWSSRYHDKLWGPKTQPCGTPVEQVWTQKHQG